MSFVEGLPFLHIFPKSGEFGSFGEKRLVSRFETLLENHTLNWTVERSLAACVNHFTK
jgi:hypothetical protein